MAEDAIVERGALPSAADPSGIVIVDPDAEATLAAYRDLLGRAVMATLRDWTQEQVDEAIRRQQDQADVDAVAGAILGSRRG